MRQQLTVGFHRTLLASTFRYSIEVRRFAAVRGSCASGARRSLRDAAARWRPA
ncbi:hypothetical protein DM46_2184 [Burkholderia mallei]|nr:hypothetical protein DM46_2184 [Burkholderia mallei]